MHLAVWLDGQAKNLMKAATSKGLSSRKSIQKALGIENIPQFILKRITAVADAINAEQADLICYLSVLIALYFSPRNLNPFSIDDSKAPEPHSTTGAPGGSSDKSSKAVNVLCRTISEKTGASPGMAQRLLKTYYMEVSGITMEQSRRNCRSVSNLSRRIHMLTHPQKTL